MKTYSHRTTDELVYGLGIQRHVWRQNMKCTCMSVLGTPVLLARPKSRNLCLSVSSTYIKLSHLFQRLEILLMRKWVDAGYRDGGGRGRWVEDISNELTRCNCSLLVSNLGMLLVSGIVGRERGQYVFGKPPANLEERLSGRLSHNCADPLASYWLELWRQCVHACIAGHIDRNHCVRSIHMGDTGT